MNVTKVPWPRDDKSSGPRRSIPGQGDQCLIYLLGRADDHADSIVPSYGQISAGCGPSPNEDFADTIWPVVVKVKPAVPKGDLIQHLRDLADVIEQQTVENRKSPMIEIKLTKTNFFTRWPCTVCGGCTEKVAILAEGIQHLSDDGETRKVRVCESCLEGKDGLGIDAHLDLRARALAAEAALVRGMIGQLIVPTFAEWCKAERAHEVRSHMEIDGIGRDEAENKVHRDYPRGPVHTEPTEEERRLGIVASGDLDSAIPF